MEEKAKDSCVQSRRLVLAGRGGREFLWAEEEVECFLLQSVEATVRGTRPNKSQSNAVAGDVDGATAHEFYVSK